MDKTKNINHIRKLKSKMKSKWYTYTPETPREIHLQDHRSSVWLLLHTSGKKVSVKKIDFKNTVLADLGI